MEERHHKQRAVPGSQLVRGYNVLQAGCQVGMRQGDSFWLGCRACRRSLQCECRNGFAAPYKAVAASKLWQPAGWLP